MTSEFINATPESSIGASALNEALIRARKLMAETKVDLWESLLSLTRVTESSLARALFVQHEVLVLSDADWDRAESTENSSKIDSTQSRCVLLKVDDKTVLLCCDPWAGSTLSALSRVNSSGTLLALAKKSQWEAVCLKLRSDADLSIATSSTSDVSAIDIDIVKFVDEVIMQAYQEGASDIHFETNRTGLRIKFRLDGVMASGPTLSSVQRTEEVISRIKVMSQLDITERRRPQDGRIHWAWQGKGSMDLRVSVMPSIFGEDVVLRLLDKSQFNQTLEAEQNSSIPSSEGKATLTLKSLGFDAAVAEAIRELALRPHGMLLVTGPTGSGKTTTVYASLSEVNDGLEKIVTIEDPVEYELPGVLQIPVNEQKGLTFATGLRSILRHDPDKILVGEIRDAETAQIAVQSSLTGHLVFTTVHANSLFDVLGRFQHFGIEPFALASALNGVVVQRLMRKLCSYCCASRHLTQPEINKLAALELEVPNQIPVAVGCPKCRDSGYRGRFVVAEVHSFTEPIRDLMVRRSSMSDLRVALYSQSSDRLLARAISKVASSETTLEEVTRVVGLF